MGATPPVRAWGFAVLAACAALAAPASARVERCYLRVDGRVYLDGPCNVEREQDGLVTIGTAGRGAPPSRHFAYLEVDEDDPNFAFFSWNGREGFNRAHVELGLVRRRGPCWRNERVEVCAAPR